MNRAIILLSLLFPLLALGQGKIHTVEYPASQQEGELVYGVTYRLWIPDGVSKIRAVIVHQHGCGEGACKGGETAADDLHWQALAKKWDAALLGPSYHQPEKADCRAWCDPRRGSEKTFLRALSDFATETKRPELATAPWCLWGHSGGGYWASLMQTLHPKRIAAIWLRSGTAFSTWEKGEVPKPEITADVYEIPVMANPGFKEKGDKRFNGAWTGALAMFEAYRAKGAPIGLAPDPKTGHECGDSRYLAIPFFDACLAMRLPEKGRADTKLKPVDFSKAWFAVAESDVALSAKEFKGDSKTAVWLPDENVAKAWMDYVKTGAVSDSSPPPAPTNLTVEATAVGQTLTWKAQADFESGIQRFIIQRDGQDIGQVPEKPVGKFGRPLFQRMSFHDTPEAPLPEMTFVDKTAPKGADSIYRILSVNSVGLTSKPSAPATSK